MHLLSLFSLLATALSFTPQLDALQAHIHKLQNQQLSTPEFHPQTPTLPRLRLPPLHTFCSAPKDPFAKVHYFQTSLSTYFCLSDRKKDETRVYSAECQLISTFLGKQVVQIICDRGTCQSGLVYFIGGDYQLYLMHEDQSFRTATPLVSASSKEQFVGAIYRTRPQNRVEIFVAETSGNLKVFDQSGVLKLRLPFHNGIKAFADHHPYPIMLSNANWLSFLDTARYLETNSMCAYLGEIQGIATDSPYEDTLYVFTATAIQILSLKSKKGCRLKQTIAVAVPDDTQISSYNGILLIGDLAYNFTDGSMRRPACKMKFLKLKSNRDDSIVAQHCCKGLNQSACTVSLSKFARRQQDRSVLLWIIVAFAVIMFLSVKYMTREKYPNILYDPDSGMLPHESHRQ